MIEICALQLHRRVFNGHTIYVYVLKLPANAPQNAAIMTVGCTQRARARHPQEEQTYLHTHINTYIIHTTGDLSPQVLLTGGTCWCPPFI